MKKNENKVANFISNKVAQQLEGIKDATSKSKTSKAKKTKAQLVEASKDAAKKFADAKLVPLKPEDPTPKGKSKKEQVIKEVEKQQKPSIIEKVISNREVKYV